MPEPFKLYSKSIEQALLAGNATEHTHRSTLEALLKALAPVVKVVNEPKRSECGAPDLVILGSDLTGLGDPSGLHTIGYVETKDAGKSLDDAERTDQLRRYLRALPNLVLTDYLEFRWYVDGERRSMARLARAGAGGKLVAEKGGVQAVEQLLGDFLAHKAEPIASPHALAVCMARLAHMIRDIIVAAFEHDKASDLLRGWRGAFATILIADLDQPEKTGEFADMLAQTLAYGLFSARVMDTSPGFTRQEAQHLIPKTNPFLRDFFYQVSGPQMDDEPFAGFVADLVALLADADMLSILAEFGKRTGQEDPIMHFYETFLAAYDPKLREMRGVYYTPTPVASYIVRSMDYLLRTRFKCAQGLADSTQIEIDNPAPAPTGKGGAKPPKKIKVHKVLLLDPATGTATFPYAVIDHIRAGFMQSGNAGMWSGYVREHLLPRLFGFELLMASYAVAHFKLGLQLAGLDLPDGQRAAWAYDFADNERIGIYLTNTLEGPHEHTGLPLFTQFLARETDAANRVKQDLPVLAIFGNPPYSGHSANKGPWIAALMEDYKRDVAGLAKPGQAKWLQDDYVKFIRWAQWRIERTGSGVLAFITNHSYLNNITFRGMRRSLMQAFTDIYVLDLHGNAKKREVAPDGGRDENVFDIQQGVAIGIFVKEPGKVGPARVHHAELWGERAAKYAQLLADDVQTTTWEELAPQAPFYLFTPQNIDLLTEYQQDWRVTDVMDLNGDPAPGIVTTHDQFAISWSSDEATAKVERLLQTASESEARDLYRLCSQSQWAYQRAKKELADNKWRAEVTPILYRPFDARWTVYNSNVAVHRRERVMRHMLPSGENVGLHLCRQIVSDSWQHILVTDHITDDCYVSNKTRERGYTLPLYLYPTVSSATGGQAAWLHTSPWPPDAHGRVPNLNPQFVADVEQRLGLKFAWGDVSGEGFTPEDVFHYIYAIFHAPAYRSRYAEFLKIDFPRVPITSDPALFWRLVALGRELVALHLLDADAAPALLKPITRFPVAGDGLVEKGHPRYDAAHRRVYISADNAKTGKQGQYFADVPPEVWDFQVGGYQPCQKWLKDRVGRKLTYDDLTHYQRIVVALSETIRLMAEIDAAIPAWPLAP